MPTYSYECPKGHAYDEVLPVAEYQKKTFCPKCKKIGQKIISLRSSEPTFSEKLFSGGIGYYDHGLGKVIHSASHRKQVMKEMDVHSKEGHRSTKARQEKHLMQYRMHNRPPM